MAIDINFGALQAANPFAAYQQGQEVAVKRGQDQAMRAAGNMFAADPDQAAQILASSGNLDGAVQLQKYGAARKQAASRAKAADLYAKGDVTGAQNEALGSGDSEFLTSIKGLSDEQRAEAKERAENIATVATHLKSLPYEQRKIEVGKLAQHPEMTAALGLKPEDLTNYDPTDETIDQTVSHALGLKGTIDEADKARDFGLKTQEFGETQRHNKAGEANAAGQLSVSRGQLAVAQGNLAQRRAEASAGDVGGLTDDSVQLLAGRYLKDGSLPPLGMGKAAAGARQQILNTASKMAASLGLSAGDLVAGTADTKAAAAALAKATTQTAAVRSFEDTASKNADLALSLAPKGGGQTGSPVVNRWLQAGRKQVAGDPAVTKFDIALGTFADEYAKVASGATGGQGSTDASRKEAYDRISKYATQGQLAGGIATMKQEMANRISSMEDVNEGLRSHLRGDSGAPPAAPQPSGKAVIRYDAQGNRIK